MKIKNVLSLLLLVTMCLACNSSKKGVSAASEEDMATPVSLENRLKQTAGVFFFGSEVRIRGGDQSFFGDSEPLFIINGQAVTGGYSAAKNMVNEVEIRSITVLKNPTDLAMYGVRGVNGVIKIKLRNTGK